MAASVKCFYPECEETATRMAEVADRVGVPMCEKHFETLIKQAIADFPEFGAAIVRSCMERASYVVVDEAGA